MDNSRRSFIKKSALALSGLSVTPGNLFSRGELPPSHQVNIGLICCKGRRYDEFNHETCDTMTVTFPKDDYVINWQHWIGVQAGPYNQNHGIEFIGDLGIIVADRSEWQVILAVDRERFDQKEQKAEKLKRPEAQKDAHAQNFIQSIKIRGTSNCPAGIGANVGKYAHLGNIARDRERADCSGMMRAGRLKLFKSQWLHGSMLLPIPVEATHHILYIRY